MQVFEPFRIEALYWRITPDCETPGRITGNNKRQKIITPEYCAAAGTGGAFYIKAADRVPHPDLRAAIGFLKNFSTGGYPLLHPYPFYTEKIASLT